MQTDKIDRQLETCSQLIIWSDSYNVGIAEIDGQHQMLISMINELHEAMSRGKAKGTMEKILVGLTSYTVYHFRTEENYFDQYAYPWVNGHKTEHADFTQKVLSFQNSFIQGKQSLSLEVLNFLCVWLRNHIDDSDRKACTFLIMRGLK